jgi:hypothetical protein
MKKLMMLVVTLMLGAGLAFAQAPNSGSTDTKSTTKTTKTTKTAKKAKAPKAKSSKTTTEKKTETSK